MRRLVWALLVVASGASGCVVSGVSADCEITGCPQGQVCYAFECRQLCNTSYDCPAGQGCLAGLCGPCQSDRHCEGLYACDTASGACHVACATDAECTTGAVCYTDGTCQPSGNLGDACKDDTGCNSGNCIRNLCCPSECELGCVGATCTLGLGEVCDGGQLCDSGFCSGGVCCDAACEGPCQRCDATGTVGQCTPLPVSEVDGCRIDVSGARMCDGRGACTGPHMLVDVNPGGGARDIVELADGTLVFFAHSPVAGEEPWVAPPGEQPRLLRDLRPGLADCEGDSMTLSTDRSRAYFVATDGVYGRTLWTTQGTVESTMMLNVGIGRVSNSPPENLTAIGPSLYFSATLGEESARAWISDGTPAGTREIEAGLTVKSNAYVPSNFIAVGSRVFFRVHPNIGGVFLHQQADPPIIEVPGCEGLTGYEPMVEYGGNLYILVDGLYEIDTTAITCTLVTAVTNGGGLQVLAGKILYQEGSPSVITTSDGTVPGTSTLFTPLTSWPTLVGVGSAVYSIESSGSTANIYTGDADHLSVLPAGYTARQDVLPWVIDSSMFLAVSHAETGLEPGHLDVSGSEPVLTALDLNPGPEGSDPEILGVVAGQVYLVATTAQTGRELVRWSRSTGDSEIIELVAGPRDAYLGAAKATATSLFISGLGDDGVHHLYDAAAGAGTPADLGIIGLGNGSGLTMPYGSSVSVTQTAGGLLFFCADDGVHGVELWVSDGTQSGTSMVRDLNPGLDSGCAGASIEPVGEQVLFAGSAEGSVTLWLSDGTASGTQEVAEIYIAGNGFGYQRFDRFAGLVVVHGSTAGDGTSIFVSDGTVENTVSLKPPAVTWDSPRLLGVTDSTMIITNGGELWQSGGTPETTSLITAIPDKQICPGFVFHQGKMYFAVQNTAQWYDPVFWESDGTPGGTVPISPPLQYSACYGGATLYSQNDLLVVGVEGGLYSIDVNDGYAWTPVVDVGGGYSFGAMAQANGLIYGGVWSDLGYELWRTEGSLASTTIVYDFNPGSANGLESVLYDSFAGRFFLSAVSNGSSSLWSTQGTGASTFRGCDAAYPCQDIQLIRALGERLYIVADFGAGVELGVFP